METQTKTIIKHLVIPGGGPTGIKALGALQYLEQNGYWDINNIETIYATSAGAILSVLLCLKFEWDTINDYIIKRPWHEVFPVTVNQVFEAYAKKGLFDKTLSEIFYKPFLDAKDIPINLTMQDLFDYSNIELHIFSLELNSFEIVDISYKTHPDLSLLTAVHMSSALPVLISPVCIDDKCYIDGGVVCNYPLKYCIERAENIHDIFGLRNEYTKTELNKVNNKSTILEYLMICINKLVNNASLKFKPTIIPNELVLVYEADLMNLTNIQETLMLQEVRKGLVDSGIKSAMNFLENKIVL